MKHHEYAFPNGKILTPELTTKVNNVVGFQDGKLPFAALYINPHEAFLLPYRYPTELKNLYDSYSVEERKVIKRTYGALIKFLYNEGRKIQDMGEEPDKEELYPSLNYIRGFTPVGLSGVRGLSRNGRLFICGSVAPMMENL
jgi:hypothetical protein